MPQNFFSSTMMPLQNKLEFLSLQSISSILYFGQVRLKPNFFSLQHALLWYSPELTANTRPGLKFLPGKNTQAYSAQFSFRHFHLSIKAAGFKLSNLGSLVVQTMSRPLARV
jgi:hypothetical protein